MCITNCHDMTLAVKVALNPNTTNYPSFALHKHVSFLGFFFRSPKNKVLKVTFHDCAVCGLIPVSSYRFMYCYFQLTLFSIWHVFFLENISYQCTCINVTFCHIIQVAHSALVHSNNQQHYTTFDPSSNNKF